MADIMTHHRAGALTCVIAVVLVASACAKGGPPKPSKTRVALSASADVNPDGTGKPSPVVVRLFQLKGDAAFTNAEFFALYDDDMKVLGPELIGREEYVLAPAEKSRMRAANPVIGTSPSGRPMRRAGRRAEC